MDGLSITWFPSNGKKLFLRTPLSIDSEPDGNGFLLSEPVYGLFEQSKSVNEGIECIRTQLSMLWDAYVRIPA